MVKQTKEKNSKLKIIEEAVKKILELVEVKTEVKIEEKEDVFSIRLQTDNPGLLIGYHGETLSSLQLILAMVVYRKTGEWTRILVDVGDYRVKRKEALERMALALAQKVKASSQPQAFPPMSSFERRIIHLALTDDAEIETASEGEGSERRVVVKLKNAPPAS